MDLSNLKQKLLNDAELPPVYTFFLDHFAEDSKFMTRGKPVEMPMLGEMVSRIIGQMFPGSAPTEQLRLIRLAKEQFVHGTFFLEGRIGGVFFFEDCATGLVAMSEPAPSINVKYARFKTRIQGPEPSRN
jgi:hypothetical protein